MSRKMSDGGLALGSLHEAGHAVLLLVLGRRFDCVLPDKVSFGKYPADGDNLPLMAHLSGAAAEAVAGGLDAWSHSTTDAGRARKSAARDLRERGEKVTTQTVADEMQGAWDALVPLLRDRWLAVVAIGGQLEASGSVSFARAACLLEDTRRAQRAEEARMRIFIGESDAQQKANREATE